MHEALFYQKLEHDRVQCRLCPHRCVIDDGKSGICRGRRNLGGTLAAEFYGQTVSIANDPIEKKPLYHFYPGRNIISLGANGCNLRCAFCQNWRISQEKAPTKKLTPSQLAETALHYGSIGAAYTYTEPFIWYEYVLDCAREIKDAGLKNVLVTNGYVNEEPLRELLPYIEGMNIDLKSIRDDFYRRWCGGRLDPVLRTIEIARRACHVELTNLIITDLNDTPEELEKLTDWVAALDKSIPLHFSRYFPCYKTDAPPTSLRTMCLALEKAQKKLDYVYLGNISALDKSNTFCPGCGTRVIERQGYHVIEQLVTKGRCPGCETPIPLIGS